MRRVSKLFRKSTMSSHNPHQLIQRGKRPVARQLKQEFAKFQPQLVELLNYLLNPSKPIDDFENIDWCRMIIAGGVSFEEFSKEVKKYDNAATCGLVWTANFVAYRCRTCGVSPCMSLCAECFQAGDHTGHDYNMFRSQAGGACDCGNTSVMKAIGFCPRHGPEREQQSLPVPQDLLAVADFMMPRLMFRLVQHLRDNYRADMSETAGAITLTMQETEQFLGFLHSLSDMGAAMRQVITKALSDKEVYRQFNQASGSGGQFHLPQGQSNYISAMETLKGPPVPPNMQDLSGLSGPLKHESLLDELLFWTLKYEFPQKLVTFLLSILPNQQYTEDFTRAFIQHYSRISVALVDSSDRQTISNRVVHVSVQLLSPEELARRMVDEYHLLYLMLISLHGMLHRVLTASDMNDQLENQHRVLDCSKDLMRDHCYWPVVSDLINVLSHRSVAHSFMRDERLLQFWLEIMSGLQGMNLNKRELVQHVEYEPETYYASFSAELEISLSPMWSLLAHCRTEDTKEYTTAVIRKVKDVLSDWFDAINISPQSVPTRNEISFHLPLHRYLATFLSCAVRLQNQELGDLLPSTSQLQMLMMHPLQLQVAFHEIFAGMWVRNGLQIKGQAMTYIQCHFCNSMSDADLYLLQVCASRLDPDYFVRTVLSRFNVLDLLTFVPSDKRRRGFVALEPEHEAPMLEGALTLLCQILSIRTFLGTHKRIVEHLNNVLLSMTDSELTRLEMLTLLCISDRTHSNLMEYMPDKCGQSGQSKDFEPTLKQLADYRAPNFEVGGAMQQGMYVSKGYIWETEFDPMYVLLRTFHRRDFQSAMDRFTTHVKQQGLYSGSGSPWPPFRPPGPVHPAYQPLRRLLQCRTMHALIFTLLHKAVNEAVIPDAVIYFTVYLLEMATSFPPTPTHGKESAFPSTPRDKHLNEWYSSDCIFTNARQVIKSVSALIEETIPPPCPPPTNTSSRGEENVQQLSLSMFQSAIAGGSVGAAQTASTLASPMPVLHEGAATSSTTPQEIINAVQAMLEEAAATLEQQPPTTSTSSSSSVGTSPTPPRRSQGVTADLFSKWKTVAVEVGESLLSLLMKLHARLSGRPNSYVPESETSAPQANVDSRIGDGPHFIGKVLDKLCRMSEENNRVLTGIYHSNLPKDGAGGRAGKGGLDKEERKRRARERQQKLMAQFASKQREFMEKIVNEPTDMESDEDKVDDAAPTLSDERLYDCVICNQTTPTTRERPLMLVSLLQSSSVLGHRKYQSEAQVLPVGELTTRPYIKTCATEMEIRIRMLVKHFDEASCLRSVNIGWEGGVYAQTCGHFVHIDCHASYVDSLKTSRQPQLQAHQGEFWCPLCRRLANTALPVVPDARDGALVLPTAGASDEQMVVQINDIIQKRVVPNMSPVIAQAMSAVVEELCSATHRKYTSFVSRTTSENLLLFSCSVLRTNLEIELLQRGGSPCRPLVLSKKSNMMPLLNVLGTQIKASEPTPYTTLWAQLTGVTLLRDDYSEVAVYQEEVPILLRDPSALLLQLVLTMPCIFTREHYASMVKSIYNLTYAQACAAISCKFTAEERSVWWYKAKQMEPTAMEGILGLVIHSLSVSSVYEDGSCVDPHVPAICQSVWSPQSVVSMLERHCVSFLRLAAMLQHHLFEEALPILQPDEGELEYATLQKYLGLVSPGSATGGALATAGEGGGDEAPRYQTGVHWMCAQPDALLRSWCNQFTLFVNKHPSVGRMLLTQDSHWEPPRLLHLPHNYDAIFQTYREKHCRNCGSVPRDPALCLMCTQLLCFKEECCKHNNISECVQHSVDCGGGTGIFLIVNSSVIAVVRGARAAIWGSVYLDEHGEEDVDLKRGKPLYLSEDRYRILQNQWINHSFDHSPKRWIFHQGRV